MKNKDFGQLLEIHVFGKKMTTDDIVNENRILKFVPNFGTDRFNTILMYSEKNGLESIHIARKNEPLSSINQDDDKWTRCKGNLYFKDIKKLL